MKRIAIFVFIAVLFTGSVFAQQGETENETTRSRRAPRELASRERTREGRAPRELTEDSGNNQRPERRFAPQQRQKQNRQYVPRQYHAPQHRFMPRYYAPHRFIPRQYHAPRRNNTPCPRAPDCICDTQT